ncbi:hypothetical protein FA13DRAFT_1797186 [Coprinellus micaceus]|uniref:Uncharacterized protein n=1 Tax=Coprinellus micaceus TaxID=71717 RepID=A0A4Y7SS50_COPMI|nr:hypothetical protein FA13DRAFT_1797186 [Coprinellus micaceus]
MTANVSPEVTTYVFLYGLFIVQALESPYYVGTERWRHLMIPLVKEVQCRLDPPGHAAEMILAWVKAKKVPVKSPQLTSRSTQAIGLVMAWMRRDGEQLNEGIGSTISRGGDTKMYTPCLTSFTSK